jgi:hypothetical protein
MGVTRNLVFPLIYGFQNTDFIRVPQGFLVDNTLMDNEIFWCENECVKSGNAFFGITQRQICNKFNSLKLRKAI